MISLCGISKKHTALSCLSPRLLCDQENLRDERAAGATVTLLTPAFPGCLLLGKLFVFSLKYQFVTSSRCRSLQASFMEDGADLQGLDEQGQNVFALPFCVSV